MKNVLYGRIKSLMERMPSWRSRVRYAHTATPTPRKKMANAIILPCQPAALSKIFCVSLQLLRKETTNIRRIQRTSQKMKQS